MSRRLLWLALWVVSIVATSQYVKAQRDVLPNNPMTAPITVAGADIAFRIQGYGQQTARGQLMVRVNGIWQIADIVPHASQGQ